MPYDGSITDFAPVTVPTVKPFDFDSATPDARLLELARMLEDEQAWRDTKMAWDFNTHHLYDRALPCGYRGCALGLSRVVWDEFNTHIIAFGYEASACEFFNLSSSEVDHLFGAGRALEYGGCDSAHFEAVTPGHVAQAIRQFVANRTEG